MSDSSATFRLGLAMAGAVSAGAYTAGALDFLVEALDSWYDGKARGDAVPRHDVSLEVASGASAGAMCGALLAAALPYDFPHARLDAQRRPSAGATDNPFYRAWVEQIDIRPMLETGDLAGGALPSLLNSDPIDGIMRQALDYRAKPKMRPWLARPLPTRFTIGNLRGVPYDVSYLGLRTASDTLYAHDDSLGFLVGGEGLAGPARCAGYSRVGTSASSTAADWQALGAAALASGAFPLFLRPRPLTRNAGDYTRRPFGSADAGLAVPPVWPKGQAPDPYEFLAVDGGIFDNEPLDLARELVEDSGGGAPASGLSSRGAVLMIAPFVDSPGSGEQLQPGAPHTLLAPMLWAFIAQCRFKPADVALAHAADVYNRFLIAPEGSRSPDAAAYWIAGGPMQGFFGFLHREYRKHDYQLGRRNCQQFLRQHFSLPKDNPVVAQGYAGLPPQPWLDDQGQLPIIPLIGAVAAEEPLCDWPSGVLDLAELAQPIARRSAAVFRYYRELAAAQAGGGLAGLAARAYLQLGWLGGRGQVQAGIRSSIEHALKSQCL